MGFGASLQQWCAAYGRSEAGFECKYDVVRSEGSVVVGEEKEKEKEPLPFVCLAGAAVLMIDGYDFVVGEYSDLIVTIQGSEIWFSSVSALCSLADGLLLGQVVAPFCTCKVMEF